MPEASRGTGSLGWPRTIATALALVFVLLTLWAFSTDLWALRSVPQGVDFISFWAAGRLALEGNATGAYDILTHYLVEWSVAPRIGWLPFAYPPPFLALLVPFALLPAGPAMVLWILVTTAFFVLSARRLARLEYVLANPTNVVDSLIGQTGFLTAGLFVLGMLLLTGSPFAGGAVLGLLVIKPQLALMIPVALIAGRKWTALGGALLSSVIAIVGAWVLFGTGAYAGFLNSAAHLTDYLPEGRSEWAKLASMFALAKYAGFDSPASLVVQGLASAGAAVLTWIAWSRDWDEKVPLVAATTLIGSPYIHTYDAVLLIVPAAYFLSRGRYWLVALLWLLCALPVTLFFGVYGGPNTIPLAAVVSIVFVVVPRTRLLFRERPGRVAA